MAVGTLNLAHLPDKHGSSFPFSSAAAIVENVRRYKNIKKEAIFSRAWVWRPRKIGCCKCYLCGCEVERLTLCVGQGELVSNDEPERCCLRAYCTHASVIDGGISTGRRHGSRKT